jgi:hypothetical protein
MSLGALFYIFAIGVFTMPDNQGQFLDIVNLIIFIIIPFIKYLAYYASYIYICLRNMFKKKKINDIDENCRDPFQYWIQLNSLTNQGEVKLGMTSFERRMLQKKINCFEKFFFNTITLNFRIGEKKIKMKIQTLVKIICALLSFIYIIYLFITKGCSVGGVFFFNICIFYFFNN